MRKGIRTILIVFFACVFLFCAVKLASVLLEYKAAEDLYTAEREAVFHVEDEAEALPGEPAAGPDAEPDKNGMEEFFPRVTVDFQALLAENPDVVGWLWLPGTNISYPLLQGADNDEYLHMTYNGEQNSAGSIFMDFRNGAGLDDDNTVIYGHNMKNGAMFGELDVYGQQDYFDVHPHVYIFTPEKTYKYTVFAAYVTQFDSETYVFHFKNGAEDYIDYVLSQSAVESPVQPDGTAPLLLLSTCTSRTQTERFVLHAVLTATRANEEAN